MPLVLCLQLRQLLLPIGDLPVGENLLLQPGGLLGSDGVQLADLRCSQARVADDRRIRVDLEILEGLSPTAHPRLDWLVPAVVFTERGLLGIGLVVVAGGLTLGPGGGLVLPILQSLILAFEPELLGDDLLRSHV